MSEIQKEKDLYLRIIKGIAAQFGKDCEVVLHDLTLPYDQTIIAIENGYITGRDIGGSGTNLGLEVLRGTSEGIDRYNYITQTKEGRILRSSSIYIRTKEEKIIGCICINYDITNLMMVERSLQQFTQIDQCTDQSRNNSSEPQEFFSKDVDELLNILIQEAQKIVGKPVVMMDKQDKIQGLRYLDKKGAFLIKKAGDKVSRFFDISKYTLYNYLDEIRNSETI